MYAVLDGGLGATRRAGAAVVPLAWDALFDLLSPGYCRECGCEVGASDAPFCPVCLQRVRWIAWACPCCGTMLPPPSAVPRELEFTDCGRCALHGRLATATAVAGIYDGPLRSAIVRYKFHGDAGVRPFLLEAARRAAMRPWMERSLLEAEALVPVPQHWTKTAWRGRNPLLDLAQESAIGSHLGPPLPVVSLLRKRRWTAPQVRLSGELRRCNLRGSFEVAPWPLRLRRVILFDDVMTTGTTLAECTRVLHRAGVESVALIVLALVENAPRR